jgi:hypothetical protein
MGWPRAFLLEGLGNGRRRITSVREKEKVEGLDGVYVKIINWLGGFGVKAREKHGIEVLWRRHMLAGLGGWEAGREFAGFQDRPRATYQGAKPVLEICELLFRRPHL